MFNRWNRSLSRSQLIRYVRSNINLDKSTDYNVRDGNLMDIRNIRDRVDCVV